MSNSTENVDFIEKAKKTKKQRKEINENFMRSGVEIIDPDNTYIDENVKIAKGSVIYPNTHIKYATEIGEGCIIGPNSHIEASKIGNNTSVKSSFIVESTVGNDCTVGPFAYIRPKCIIGNKVKVGDFVELKASIIGDGTKASHLTYVGDAVIGKNVNFGCGTVVVNYDGACKYKTTVGDNAFIGCNTNLVSPVTIGDGAYTAAGSTITDEVPSDTLAIARARQIIKKDWKRKTKEIK